MENKIDKFELWKEYEKIATHFNELLIQLRVRALGGLGVIVAIISFAAKTKENPEINWELVMLSFAILSVIWIAIGIIDLFYYNRLLLGAVQATIKLENQNEKHISINFSNELRESSEGNLMSFPGLWPIYMYYVIVFIVLLLCAIYSFSKTLNKNDFNDENFCKICMHHQ